MSADKSTEAAAFARLLVIMDELREKCPWDRKQTIETIRHLSIEEVYELSDAILNQNNDGIRQELGDLLLHIVFYARIGSETNLFDITGVIETLCEKLIRRHPHIYGNVEADTAEKVTENWEAIKMKEKGAVSVLGGVPAGLPALVKALRIQEKAGAFGFEWQDKTEVMAKIREEIDELQAEVNQPEPNADRIEDELGDLLFAVVNYSRYIKANPEDALEHTNRKFIRRFNYIEQQAKATNQDLKAMSLEAMDALWNEAKGRGL